MRRARVGGNCIVRIHKRASILLFLLSLVILNGACSSKVFTNVTTPRAPDQEIFQQGIESFKAFTPLSYARAAELFRRATKIAPRNCLYRLHLAEALLFLALELKLNRQNYLLRWQEAVSILSQTRSASKEKEIIVSSNRVSDCSNHLAIRARLDAISLLDEFGSGGDTQALEKIAQAIELEPRDPLNWWVRWKLNPSTRRQENAILKATSLSKDLALIHYAVGNYWLIKADYSQAKISFQRALELSPKHFRSYIGLAQALSATDNNEDVEHLYRKATDLAPDFIEGRILLGDYLAGLEETERALVQYQAVIKQDPNYEIAHLRRGVTLLQSGNFKESASSFKRAIELNPSSYQAYYYLGNVSLSERQLDQAKELYEESLKYVLNFPQALYALGTIHFRKGNIDVALEHFERVLALDRSNADAYFSRAAIYVQRKLYGSAIEDYNLALAIYDKQLIHLRTSIVDLDERGLAKKATVERQRKERLETLISRTLRLKMEAEDIVFKGP